MSTIDIEVFNTCVHVSSLRWVKTFTYFTTTFLKVNVTDEMFWKIPFLVFLLFWWQILWYGNVLTCLALCNYTTLHCLLLEINNNGNFVIIYNFPLSLTWAKAILKYTGTAGTIGSGAISLGWAKAERFTEGRVLRLVTQSTSPSTHMAWWALWSLSWPVELGWVGWCDHSKNSTDK